MRQKRFISLLILVFLVTTLIYPSGLPVYAESDPGNYTFDISEGDITITAGTTGGAIKVSYGGTSELDNILASQEITLIGTSTVNKVVVDGVAANITINNLDIQVDSSSAFSLNSGASVTLTKVGSNTLKSTGNYPGLKVEVGQAITIGGMGSLTAEGNSFAAGIGSGISADAGFITITGGEVTAVASVYGAGIGGGMYGTGGNITITGGTVVTSSTNFAAGIGGGMGALAGNIIITGGTVVASTAGFGAAIGVGMDGTGGNITITDGKVTAMSSSSGTGIGGHSLIVINISSAAEVKALTTGITSPIEGGFTGNAKILMAQFQAYKPINANTSVYDKSNSVLTNSITSPIDSFKMVAFTVPANGIYQLKYEGIVQTHSSMLSADFEIATDGITTFTNVKDIVSQATPSFSIASGEVTAGTMVTISSAGADAIYYTIDGSEPTTASINQATTPLVINGAMTVKAIAVKAGIANSTIATTNYTVAVAPTDDLTNIELSGTPTNFIYAEGIYTYNGVTVANSVDAITVTPIGVGTITVDGTEVTSGDTSAAITLTAGVEKTITIVATEAGKTAKTYTIKVTRGLAPQTTPSFSIASGEVAAGTAVTISSVGADAIYYTTDGSEPTTASINQAITPLVINGAMTVKAIAVKAGVADSAIGMASYTIPETTSSGGNSSHHTRSEDTDMSIGTSIDTKKDGKTTTIITVEENKLEKALESEENNGVITIPANADADSVVGELNGEMVKNMEEKQAVVEVKTDIATYSLPAKEININDVSKQLGTNVDITDLKDIKVMIEVVEAPETKVEIVENAANEGGFTLIAPPVEFNVRCMYNDNTIEVKKFNSYVERTVAIPENINPEKITTGVVIDTDGTLRHVPTQITIIDGKYYAKIHSLTNSTYSVVWHPMEFIDIENHWAKEEINDMGSRMVINGIGNGMFEPDRNITRAEFAKVIVTGLGLKPGNGNNPFVDVESTDWYCKYVETAYEYGITMGYGEDEFGPMDYITREQAMVMIDRAMEITGLKTEISNDELDKLFEAYGDINQSSLWAQNGIAKCIKTGIILGENNNIIAPKDEITRAEVAVIVARLLKKSSLI